MKRIGAAFNGYEVCHVNELDLGFLMWYSSNKVALFWKFVELKL